MDCPPLLLSKKEIEIIELKNQLHEEQQEKLQLKQKYEKLVSERTSMPTSVSFFSPPANPSLLTQIEHLKETLEDIKALLQHTGTDIGPLRSEVVQLKEIISNQHHNSKEVKQEVTSAPVVQNNCMFNPATTKVIHLIEVPPLSPKAAQFYSSTKSNDKAIAELQQQLNDSRKEAKRIAEVATRKCKDFRSLCCKLFGWRVDVLDSEKRNVKNCRVHSIFNEEDYLCMEFKRKNCNLKPSKFLEGLDPETVGGLMNEGGIPRLLHQLYQFLSTQAEEGEEG